MNRDTICVQGGYTPGNGEPRQIPIIQSTTFKYATSEDMGKLFDLEADGYFYSRLQNPTCDMVAKKICELEGGTAAMLTSSGQAANFFALFNICEAGDHIVASSTIYGGTFNLISVTMAKMGITATFVDPLCTEEELNAAFRPNTKVVFGETIANPALTVLDIEKFAKAAHAHGVPLVVDNTFPTPVNCRPFEWGADIVTHSTTKYMDGHGTAVGSSIYPAFTKYFLPELVDKYPHSVEKAKELLAQAGYPNGFDMTISVPNNYQPHMDTAEVVAEQLREAGIRVTIQPVEWSTWLDTIYNGRQFQATVVGVDAANMTARAMLERFTSDYAKNFINYSNPAYDALFQQAINATDEAAQTDLYKQMETMLADTAANVYIQDLSDLVAMRQDLGGLKFYPIYVLDLSTVYLTQR